MKKLIGLGIAGTFALIVLFSMMSPVASSMTDAQHSWEVQIEDNTILSAGEDIVETVDAIQDREVRATVDVTGIDAGDEATISLSGDTAEDTVTVTETGEVDLQITADQDTADFQITADAENTGDVEADYEVESEQENQFASFMAIVLIIFITSFALLVWKAIG